MERILKLLQIDMEKDIDKYFNDHKLSNLHNLSEYINSLFTNEKMEQIISQELKSALDEQSMTDGYWWMEYGEYIQYLNKRVDGPQLDLSLLEKNINSYVIDKQEEFYKGRAGKKKTKRKKTKRKKTNH